jgi:hypothetical protein
MGMNHLQNLGSQVSIPIRPDKDGYVGRECPIEECLGYFKITPGTGVKSPAPSFCPYCGYSGENNTFFTQEQIEYALSVVTRQVTDALRADLKSLEFDHKPRGAFGIGISLRVQPSVPMPIRYYREKQLETEVICDNCTLRYAIYGVFGWCPDCGVHNSLQILTKNLDLAKKELTLAESAERELADHLVGDALENVVSAFDGFGREICVKKAADIHFQNLAGARRRVQEAFGVDFADGLDADEWARACRIFQKRHLLAHKMGVVDEDYVKKVNDPQAIVGRKISVGSDEVTWAIGIVEALGRRLFNGVLHPKP